MMVSLFLKGRIKSLDFSLLLYFTDNIGIWRFVVSLELRVCLKIQDLYSRVLLLKPKISDYKTK